MLGVVYMIIAAQFTIIVLSQLLIWFTAGKIKKMKRELQRVNETEAEKLQCPDPLPDARVVKW